MTPVEYERAVLERCKIAWPSPDFEVRHNIKLRGKKTKVKRQVDIAIYAIGVSKPIMLVEAKRHNRPISADIAGSTIAMMQDVGGIPSIMVATAGFSIAAANHLDTEAIGHITITLTEAMALRWIPEIKARFVVDGEFAIVSGELVEAMRRGDVEPFFDTAVPYEEWCAALDCGLSFFPTKTRRILIEIAFEDYESDHRYNAIQILSDVDGLSATLVERLLERESDPDTRDMLLECASNL